VLAINGLLLTQLKGDLLVEPILFAGTRRADQLQHLAVRAFLLGVVKDRVAVALGCKVAAEQFLEYVKRRPGIAALALLRA
jgi:hypothetical protein